MANRVGWQALAGSCHDVGALLRVASLLMPLAPSSEYSGPYGKVVSMAKLSVAEMKGRRLGRILTKMGKVKREQVHEALKLQRSRLKMSWEGAFEGDLERLPRFLG